MLGFKQYMISNHINEQTPKGDLARDLKMDKEFPRISCKKEGIIYLENRGACYNAIKTFKDSWKEYKGYRLKEISKINNTQSMIYE